jgi:hypothetical protein
VVEVAEVLDVTGRATRQRGLFPQGERQHRRAVPTGLLEHTPPAGQLQRMRVGEAAYPAQRAQVVVERPVLLHQHDDVLDRVEVAPAHRLGHRHMQRGRQQGTREARARGGEHATAGERDHGGNHRVAM